MNIDCYAVKQPKSQLEPYHYNSSILGPHDIEVDITHCGICHSDIHLMDNDWGVTTYPAVPGHEIVGHIKAAGSAVRHLNVGDRVGIGWQRSSCMECEWCHKGEENLCYKQEATCVGHFGGYAEKIIADGRFAFKIPEKLASEHAAPLMCGGVTVFSPFIEHKITPLTKVGIVGIGGLGHLALKFARAWGCEVTAFSSKKDKEAELKELGAHHFVLSTDVDSLKRVKHSLDFLLMAGNVSMDWQNYLDILRPKGIFCCVGVTPQPLEISAFSLIESRKNVCGSNIGSRSAIVEMLRFTERHGIQPQIELFSMRDANQAIAKVREGKVRYRAVLVN